MRNTSVIRGLVAALCAALLASSATADIKSFNAAVKAGDYKKAAEEAKPVWAEWDKTKADTAIMAREFGFASYVAGDFAAARDYGQFLKDQGASLPTPDDQPATSRVLLAAANYRLAANDGTRNALFDALKGREAAPGFDSMSLLAAEALYRGDWNGGSWGKASESGKLAYRLISRGGDTLLPRALEARGSGAAAGFLGGRDKQDYDELMDTHDALVAAIDKTTDLKRREALVLQAFTVAAWASSVLGYFDAADQIGSNVPVRVKKRDFSKPKSAYFPQDPNACPLVMERGTLSYPTAAGFKGMVGTVTMKFDLDGEGRIIKSEVLASVPARHFADAVTDAIPSMRATKYKDAKAGCTIARKDWVWSIGFRIA